MDLEYASTCRRLENYGWRMRILMTEFLFKSKQMSIIGRFQA